jgi:hypothetical protein
LFIVRRNTTLPDWSFRATSALVSPTGDNFAKQVRQELPKSTKHTSLKLIIAEEPVCLHASSVSAVFGLAAFFPFFYTLINSALVNDSRYDMKNAGAPRSKKTQGSSSRVILAQTKPVLHISEGGRVPL